MDILGSIGKLYTFILLVVLFLGSGLAVWAAINTAMNNKDKLKVSTDKIRTNLTTGLQTVKNNNILGGIKMKNSGFIKLAVFSFIGIIISAAILTALPKYTGNPMNNMNTQYGVTSMSMQGMPGYSMQPSMNDNSGLNSIQQQLNQMQQQINNMQNQMSNSMNSMQNNSNNNMNNNNMNNNMNNNNSNSNSSSMSSMPMM